MTTWTRCACGNRTTTSDRLCALCRYTLKTVDDSRRKPPTGRCHDCGRPVTGQRRLCGMCAVKRENGRKR